MRPPYAHRNFDELRMDFPELGAEVDQIHDARNVVSATVSVLKSGVAIFRPTS